MGTIDKIGNGNRNMMQKAPVDLQELFQHVLLEVRATWRYRWHALAVAWGVMIVGALMVFSLPNKYAASAEVYADTDALTNPLLHGIAVQPDVRGRLQIITHTMLSRPNLEEVADKTGLSLRATSPADKDALLGRLGAAVTISSAGTKDLYRIDYSDPDREMAQKVVQAFLQILMNDTLGANTSSTRTATNFLQQQVEDYGKQLNEAERELAEFKKANIGYIPNQGGSGYFNQLQSAQAKLQELQLKYDTSVAARASAEQQMHALGSGSVSQRTVVDPRIRDIDAQIADYQKKLSNLLLKYTDKYPDVITAKRMIAQLEERRETLKKGGGGSSVMSVVSDNPVYQEMQKSLYDTEVGIKVLATQIAQQKQQIAELMNKADKITDVQATLQRLTRNYDITKKQYDELAARLNTAQLSQDATKSGNNLKFRVIDPPVVPLTPESPKRGLFLLLVFVMAVVIGVAFAYFMHLIRPVFVSLRRLRESGDYPVLGAVSLIVSPLRREEQRREVIGFCAGAGMLAVVLLLGMALKGPLTHLVQQFFVMGVA